jgi:uncharacterized heparinase superfamily protein
MSAAGRYCRTVLHLRPRQVWTRVARRVVRPRLRSEPEPAPARRAPAASLATPIAREDGWLSPTRVRLLNIERQFDGGIDWRPSDVPRLWVYTLNYFQDLPQCAVRDGESSADGGMNVEDATRLVDSWIDANPPGTLDTWDPYPISIRTVNWIKWMLRLEESGRPGALADSDRVLDSLAAQLRFLERRLEFDIAANHVMANAVALTAGGLFFGGKEGDRWASSGFALLFRELEEQVRDDGGHYERTPTYHAVVLEQLLDVLNLWDVLPEGVPREWRDARHRLEGKAVAMLEWLDAMTHPDGAPAFFNDTTFGAAPTLDALVDYARKLGLTPMGTAFSGVHRLDATGFFRLASPDGRTVVLFDAGSPQPRYQPGHAHSESLSFELSREGQRLFVNSGVSTYESGPERLRQRQTAAHNTVRIDEEEQSEVWASHRCGRRARVSRAGERDGWVYAEHTGYRFLRGRPRHYRSMRVADSGVEIIDNIEGVGEHLLEWFFHVHPDATAQVRDRTVDLSLDGHVVATMTFPFGASAAIVDGRWHPGFNISVHNTFVHVVLRVSLPFEFHTTIDWI